MKMRVLTATNKGKLLSIANSLAKKNDCRIDTIPPAYSCEREKLVIMVISATASMPNAFDLFCKSLNKQNAYKVVDMINNAGGNVMDDILYVDGGLPFKFLKKVSDEDMAKVNEWSDRIVAAVSSNAK